MFTRSIVIVLFCGLMALSTQAAEEKPNVLFIIADDLMKQVELYGHDDFRTPELSKLSKEAMLFDRAYCQYPLCGPSRASMMLSAYPTRSGITWNQGGKSTSVQKKAAALGVSTMPAYFKSQGYITVGGGKLYHDSVIPGKKSAAHDFTVAFDNHGKDGVNEKCEDGKKRTRIIQSSPHSIEEHKDGHLVEQAKTWLATHAQSDSDDPFFMCIGIKKPHSPYAAPKQFFDLYQRENMKVSEVKAPNDIILEYSLSAPTALLSVHSDTIMYDGHTLPEAKKKEMIHGYSACVSYADYLVGDLVRALKENGFYDNTVIVFTSDHGYKLGEYDRWAKFTLHEKDCAVPLLVRAPGAAQGHGSTTKSMVGLLDIYPTLAELCGLPTPDNIDGISFAKTLSHPNEAARTSIQTFVTRAGKEGSRPPAVGASLMQDNGYRFTQWTQEKATDFPSGTKPVGIELYDHYHSQNTPISTKNLSAELPEIVESMSSTVGK